MYEIVQHGVFSFIKGLYDDKNSAYSKYMNDAIFIIPTLQLLSKIVDSLDGIYDLIKKSLSRDTKGDMREYLLSKISTSGLIGQFRTSRHIIKMIVKLMAPKSEDTISDLIFKDLIQFNYRIPILNFEG